MGRRALRKIDPSVDLSNHLFQCEGVSPPLDAAALFECEGPLELEIGTGKGLFLLNASGERPEHNFLGVEIASSYATFSAARLARAGRTNAKVADGDALVLIAALADAACAAVHVYFPDPWWKKRHRKRRVLTAEMIRHIERVLESGGELHLWSDVEEYFEATLELIGEKTRLEGPVAVPERSPEHDLDYLTNFERRKRKEGRTIHRSRFAKP